MQYLNYNETHFQSKIISCQNWPTSTCPILHFGPKLREMKMHLTTWAEDVPWSTTAWSGDTLDSLDGRCTLVHNRVKWRILDGVHRSAQQTILCTCDLWTTKYASSCTSTHTDAQMSHLNNTQMSLVTMLLACVNVRVQQSCTSTHTLMLMQTTIDADDNWCRRQLMQTTITTHTLISSA